MLYQLLLWLLGALVLSALGLVLHSIVACRLAYLKFKKASKGLPFCEENCLLGNGVFVWGVGKNQCTRIRDYMSRMGVKTFGLLHHTIPAAATIDLNLIKRIHDEPEKHMNRISTTNLPIGEIEQSIMLAEGERWRKLRRIFAPALRTSKFKTPNVMAEIEGSIEKLIGMIDAKLADKSKQLESGGRRVDVDDLTHRFSLDLAFSCLYKQSDLINFDEKPCPWTQTAQQGLHAVQSSPIVHASFVVPVLRPLIDRLIWIFHPQGEWRRGIINFIYQQTQLGLKAREEAKELRAAGKQVDPDNFLLKDGTKFRRNMIDHVVDRYLDGEISKEDYISSSSFLLIASNVTSADALTHTLYQVAVNPKIQERLRQSIREHGANSEYLVWVLNESMRLMPPVNVGCSRTIGEDLQIEGGHVLPKGTFVITPVYAIHRLPEYWGHDADEFKPERWRDTSHHHPYQFMPFGAGPRGCPGKEFALFEMKQLLAALLTRYEFEAQVKEDLDVFDSPIFIYLLPNSPTYVTIKKLQS